MLKTLKSRIVLIICGVVALSLFGFTAAVVFSRVSDEIGIARERQKASIATAAAMFDREFSGVEVEFAADGAPSKITWDAEPDLAGHTMIDRIGAITGETATVFAFETGNGDFWRRSTNIIKPDGSRAVGTKLGINGAVHPVIMSGKVYEGEATILGKDYYTIYFPIHDRAGSIAGILYVGVSKEAISAAAFDTTLRFGAWSLLALLLASGVAYYFVGRALAGFSSVRGAMSRISSGEISEPVEGVDRTDEVGDLARAVDGFRSAMLEAEEARAERRRQYEEGAKERAAPRDARASSSARSARSMRSMVAL